MYKTGSFCGAKGASDSSCREEVSPEPQYPALGNKFPSAKFICRFHHKFLDTSAFTHSVRENSRVYDSNDSTRCGGTIAIDILAHTASPGKKLIGNLRACVKCICRILDLFSFPAFTYSTHACLVLRSRLSRTPLAAPLHHHCEWTRRRPLGDAASSEGAPSSLTVNVWNSYVPVIGGQRCLFLC